MLEYLGMPHAATALGLAAIELRIAKPQADATPAGLD
jgi:hypothetical protein